MASGKNKKIGLFGGTFDPIHTGHLIVAEIIRDTLNLDRVIFIPASKHPFKNNSFISDQTHRLKMIRLAIRNNKHLAVSDIELKTDQVTYTVDTIEKFREDYPEGTGEIYFLMGMDNLNQFHLWKEPDRLVELCKIVVFTRPGFEPARDAKKYQSRIRIIQIPLLEISSTQIRKRVKSRHTIRYLVPPDVESYIVKNKLYLS